MFNVRDWYAGMEGDHMLVFECVVTDRAYAGDYFDPGWGTEFDVTAVYMDDAPVTGAQRKYLIESRWEDLCFAAQEYDYATRR